MPAGLLWITWSKRKTAELLGGGGGRGSPGVRSSGGRLKRTKNQLQYLQTVTVFSTILFHRFTFSLFCAKIQVFLITFFLAAPRNSWDLGSLTRDQTRAQTVKARSPNLGTSRKPLFSHTKEILLIQVHRKENKEYGGFRCCPLLSSHFT